MNGFRLVPPARLVLVLGCLTGLLAGLSTVALGRAALMDGGAARGPSLEVSHLPPLLTRPAEEVELVYEAFCVGLEVDAETGCEVDGRVFVRPVGSQSFDQIPLRAQRSEAGRELVARVPRTLTEPAAGFEYYAQLSATGSADVSTIPSGGSTSPHRSTSLGRHLAIDLGRHPFGRTRAADARVASAAWGSGPNEVGLEQGRNLPPIGASAFDVDPAGEVYLLDEAKRRVLRWPKGTANPQRLPVSIAGTLADLAVDPDGSIFVLETVGAAGGSPLVRRFDQDGRELERAPVAESSASQIRPGPAGPVVLQQPANLWMPVLVGGTLATPAEQRRNASAGRPLPGGGAVTVLRVGDEIRVALQGPNGARRAWRLRSETPVAEVQLAERLGNRLLLVVRMYTEDQSDFQVLVLDGRGIVERFAVNAADWAETAPLGRFRLVGSALYRLGSTPREAFVDRFDLEVRR